MHRAHNDIIWGGMHAATAKGIHNWSCRDDCLWRPFPDVVVSCSGCAAQVRPCMWPQRCVLCPLPRCQDAMSCLQRLGCPSPRVHTMMSQVHTSQSEEAPRLLPLSLLGQSYQSMQLDKARLIGDPSTTSLTHHHHCHHPTVLCCAFVTPGPSKRADKQGCRCVRIWYHVLGKPGRVVTEIMLYTSGAAHPGASLHLAWFAGPGGTHLDTQLPRELCMP
jgi:hypothetical protein